MHFSIKFKLLIKFQLLTEHSQKASLWRKNSLEVNPIDNDGFQEFGIIECLSKRIENICILIFHVKSNSNFSRSLTPPQS